jgi:hypothetical protein
MKGRALEEFEKLQDCAVERPLSPNPLQTEAA